MKIIGLGLVCGAMLIASGCEKKYDMDHGAPAEKKMDDTQPAPSMDRAPQAQPYRKGSGGCGCGCGCPSCC